MWVNISATWFLRATIGSWNIYSKSHYFCIPQAKREQFARRQKQIRYSRRNPHRSHSTLHPTQTNYASLLLARICCTQECSWRTRPPAASPTLDLSFHCAHTPLYLFPPPHTRGPEPSGRTRPWNECSRDFIPSSGGRYEVGLLPPIGRPSILVYRFLVSRGSTAAGWPVFRRCWKGYQHAPPWAACVFADENKAAANGQAGGRAGAPSLGFPRATQLWSYSTQLATRE